MKLGYSLRYMEETMVAMGVSPMEPGRWRIENLEQNQAAAGPSSTLVKEMVKNSPRVTMLVPGTDVRTSLITLPKLKKKEMGRAVAGWVAREESAPQGEFRVSWRERRDETRGENKDTKDLFLLYTSNKDVNRQLALAENWGGKPQRMLPDFMILDGMFRRHHPLAKDLSAWNVVFIGKTDHFLCVSTPASLLLTRPLPADLSEGADAGEYLERLATEVDRSIFFARQTEFNPDVQRIVVCGDPELAQGLVAHLKEVTSVPAEFWDVAQSFEMESGHLDSQLILPAMTAALALHGNPFNLLPKQPRNILGPVARSRLVLAASTAAVALVPMLVAGGLVTSSVQDRYLHRARQELVESSIRAEKAADVYKAQRVLVAKEEHIAAFSNNDTDYAGVLLHLANLTPHQIIYQDLRLKETKDGQLVLYLSGESKADTVAEAQQSFLLFQQALRGSKMLVAAGEPRKLIINTQNIKGVSVKKVEFSMEYQVKLKTQLPTAVASIVARAEG